MRVSVNSVCPESVSKMHPRAGALASFAASLASLVASLASLVASPASLVASPASLVASLASLVALLVGCASQPPPKSQPSPLLGDIMPAFQSTTLSGNPVISGAYDRHKVVLSFVGVKCEPCERVLTAAQAVYSDDREVVVVGVFRKEDSENALSTAARLSLRFPVVVDRDGKLAKQFQIQGVPSTFVVDTRGRVSWLGGSDLTEDGLSAALHAAE